MGVLIDTSVIISAARGKLEWDKLIASYAPEPMAISVITASELLPGVHRSSEAARPAREAYVERILTIMPVVSLDLAIARVHARLGAALSAAGQAIGAHDLLIAATAVSMGYRVVTRDMRSFPRVPGLAVTVMA
jgi:tRNA(fMet)-specific endonuclease VapC